MKRIRLPSEMVEAYFEGLDRQVGELRDQVQRCYELANRLTDDWAGYNFDPDIAEQLHTTLGEAIGQLDTIEDQSVGDYIDVWLNE